MKQITVNLKFERTASCISPYNYVQNVIAKELRKKGIKIHKYRNTYFECKHGIVKLPNDLFLANLIDSPSGSGFSWKLPELSGKYTFKFKQ